MNQSLDLEEHVYVKVWCKFELQRSRIKEVVAILSFVCNLLNFSRNWLRECFHISGAQGVFVALLVCMVVDVV